MQIFHSKLTNFIYFYLQTNSSHCSNNHREAENLEIHFQRMPNDFCLFVHEYKVNGKEKTMATLSFSYKRHEYKISNHKIFHEEKHLTLDEFNQYFNPAITRRFIIDNIHYRQSFNVEWEFFSAKLLNDWNHEYDTLIEKFKNVQFLKPVEKRGLNKNFKGLTYSGGMFDRNQDEFLRMSECASNDNAMRFFYCSRENITRNSPTVFLNQQRLKIENFAVVFGLDEENRVKKCYLNDYAMVKVKFENTLSTYLTDISQIWQHPALISVTSVEKESESEEKTQPESVTPLLNSSEKKVKKESKKNKSKKDIKKNKASKGSKKNKKETPQSQKKGKKEKIFQFLYILLIAIIFILIIFAIFLVVSKYK